MVVEPRNGRDNGGCRESARVGGSTGEDGKRGR